jgi:ATP/maltotriose-dependent transcriptional regulator MalT
MISTPIPKVKLVDRKEELQKLHSLLNKGKAIFISGESGVGKTTLAAKFAAEIKNLYKIFWFSIGPQRTVDEIFLALNDFLIRNGNFSFKKIQGDENLTLEEKIHYLLQSINERGYGLFFDERGWVEDKLIINLLNSLIHNVCRSNCIVIIGKPFPNCCSDSHTIIDLKPFGLEDSIQILRRYDFKEPESVMRRIHTTVGGNCSRLRLIAKLSKIYGLNELLDEISHCSSEIDQVLFKYLFSSLSVEEKKILVPFFVIPHPLDATALMILSGIENFNEVFKNLQERFPFFVDNSGRYWIQEGIILRYLYDELSEDPIFWDVSLRISQQIGDKAASGRVYFNLGCIHYKNGKINEALKFFKKALEIGKKVKDRELIKKFYKSIG